MAASDLLLFLANADFDLRLDLRDFGGLFRERGVVHPLDIYIQVVLFARA